ncbi:hypothetical protein KAS31_00285 [Candidatus Parcubacteria bacterium]|nr:hypothetical protein [Candidatus Parcubacteria bacterium]
MNRTKLIIALVMIVIGVVGRFILVSYAGIPNLEIITVLALIAGIYLGGVYAVVVPLSVIFLSDLVIGNTYIFIFTWTAFAVIGLFGYASRKVSLPKIGLGWKKSIVLALLSSIFFYLYTNFGWWLMSGMYEYSLSGIIRCYYMAIPFFRNNLVGNLIFVPIGIYVASKVFCNVESYNVSKILLQEKKDV